jgi:hypothetical protein
MDGVSYHFACYGSLGWMAGKTWSPRHETAPGRLVSLAHLLCRYVEATETERGGLECEIRETGEWFRALT